jgi:hypothetical protein
VGDILQSIHPSIHLLGRILGTNSPANPNSEPPLAAGAPRTARFSSGSSRVMVILREEPLRDDTKEVRYLKFGK